MIRYFIAAIVLLTQLVTPLHANIAPVCLVLVSGTSLSDWRATGPGGYPTLGRILDLGSVAVMNARTARSATEDAGPSPYSSALSLSAGSRCVGSADTVEFAPAGAASPYGGSTNAEILQRRIGISAPPNSLVDIAWSKLLYANSKLGYRAVPGSLVKDLRNAGFAVYASGGPEALAAGVGDGYVECGSPVANGDALPANTLWIVDAGSSNAPGAADALLGRIAAKIDASNGTLIVASLYTGRSDYLAGRRLTPVLIYGAAWQRGSLYSPSTHTAGLIILSDLTPTIERIFGLHQTDLSYGRGLSGLASDTPVDTAADIEATANAQRAAMGLLPDMAIVLGLLLGVMTILTLAGRDVCEYWIYLPMLLLVAIICPNVLLLFIVLSAVCVRNAVSRIRIGSHTLFAVCLGSMLLVLISFINGDWLMHHSLIGYSVIEGARYYGIGNEAMGILFGSTLVVALVLGQWFEEKSAVPLVLLFLIVVLVLGLPSAGAKVGGVLVGVGTFGVFMLRWSGRKVCVREGLGIAALTLVILAGLVAIDRHSGSAHASHLGQLWTDTQTGGVSDLVDTMFRKGQVELRLLYHSCWAVALAGGLWAFIALRKKTNDRAAQAFQAASVVATILTLLLNDAGVVACALMLPYLAAGSALTEGTHPAGLEVARHQHGIDLVDHAVSGENVGA